MAEHLPSLCEAPGSMPGTMKVRVRQDILNRAAMEMVPGDIVQEITA